MTGDVKLLPLPRAHTSSEDCNCEQVGYAKGWNACVEAALEAAREDAWQPIETAPELRKIIVSYKNALGNRRTVMAEKVGKFQREHTDPDSECCEHDEATDCDYWPAGWYEVSVEPGESWVMTSLPSHWRPLPAPPAIDAARKEKGDE